MMTLTEDVLMYKLAKTVKLDELFEKASYAYEERRTSYYEGMMDGLASALNILEEEE